MKSHEIPREFDLIAVPITDLGVNGKAICDFILVINSNFIRICYRFRRLSSVRNVLRLNGASESISQLTVCGKSYMQNRLVPK